MTRYLLDTNVVSEFRKPRPHERVWAWFESLRENQIYLSAVTLGELQRGIELTRRQDRIKAQNIESWVDYWEATQNLLPMDAACFREWARLMVGKSETLLEDAMIAATARVHGLTVATRNTDDFALLHVPVLNPFGT